MLGPSGCRAYISHDFGYGVGYDMPKLLAKYRRK